MEVHGPWVQRGIENDVKPVEIWGRLPEPESSSGISDDQGDRAFWRCAFNPFDQGDRCSGDFTSVNYVKQHLARRHGQSYLAVKELHSDGRLAFAKELQALQLLNSKPHQHIVSLLGSYRYRAKYHLVFPWADSDLSMFWRLNPNPQPNRELAGWVVEQTMGLVDALCKIHGLGNRNDDSSNNWSGRHGDIKPSNILCFSTGNRSLGTLKLADFGLSSFRTSGTADHEQMDEGPIRYTPAYRAPEFALPQDRIGQMSDIWGLGCVFLEFVSWYLLGVSAVDEVASWRTDDPEQTVSTGDAFFEVFGASGHEDARLKPRIRDVRLWPILFHPFL